MNIALEKCEEHVNGVKKRSYGDAFVRGNNGECGMGGVWPSRYKLNVWAVMYISADAWWNKETSLGRHTLRALRGRLGCGYLHTLWNVPQQGKLIRSKHQYETESLAANFRICTVMECYAILNVQIWSRASCITIFLAVQMKIAMPSVGKFRSPVCAKI